MVDDWQCSYKAWRIISADKRSACSEQLALTWSLASDQLRETHCAASVLLGQGIMAAAPTCGPIMVHKRGTHASQCPYQGVPLSYLVEDWQSHCVSLYQPIKY